MRSGRLALTIAGGLVGGDLSRCPGSDRSWLAGRRAYVDVPDEHPPGILPFLRLPALSDLQQAEVVVALALVAAVTAVRPRHVRTAAPRWARSRSPGHGRCWRRRPRAARDQDRATVLH